MSISIGPQEPPIERAARRPWLNPLLAKVLTIGVLTLLLLIPLSQVRGLIGERVQMRGQAVLKVAGSWGGNQELGAPVLTVPFETVTNEGDKGIVRSVSRYRMLASQVRIKGELQPQSRYVGIYSVPVYTLNLQLDGSFKPEAIRELTALVATPGRTVFWDQASVFLPVGDPKGIRKISQARWGSAELALEPGHYDSLPGISAPVNLEALQQGKEVMFSFRIDVAGSERLRVLPLARSTEVSLESKWPDPSFSGAYAPGDLTVGKQGFSASWQVLELNRQFPQQWADELYNGDTLRAAGFGVDLFQSVDTYHRNERATKYAVLFIALTFMSVFLWEVAGGARVHAMQYLLVGLALSVFYLVLLALSEHIPFAAAYASGAGALTMLIGTYLGGAMRNGRAGAVAGLMIGVVYALLYLLILSEQYALLFGAILLFAILAAIMLCTRKYDWNSFGSKRQ